MRNVAPRIEADMQDLAPAGPAAASDEAAWAPDDPDWDDGLEDDDRRDLEYLHGPLEETRSRWTLARRIVLAVSILIAACFAAAPSIYFFFFRHADTEIAAVAPAAPDQRVAAQSSSMQPADAALSGEAFVAKPTRPDEAVVTAELKGPAAKPRGAAAITPREEPGAPLAARVAPLTEVAVAPKIVAGPVRDTVMQAVAPAQGRASQPALQARLPSDAYVSLPSSASGLVRVTSPASLARAARPDPAVATIQPALPRFPGLAITTKAPQPTLIAARRPPTLGSAGAMPRVDPQRITRAVASGTKLQIVPPLRPGRATQLGLPDRLASRTSSPLDPVSQSPIPGTGVAHAAVAPVGAAVSQLLLPLLVPARLPVVLMAKAGPQRVGRGQAWQEAVPAAAAAAASIAVLQPSAEASDLTAVEPRPADRIAPANPPSQAEPTRRVVVASLQPLDGFLSLLSSPIGASVKTSPAPVSSHMAAAALAHSPGPVIQSVGRADILVVSLPPREALIAPAPAQEPLPSLPDSQDGSAGVAGFEDGGPAAAPTPKPRPEYRAAKAAAAESAKISAARPQTAKAPAGSRPVQAQSRPSAEPKAQSRPAGQAKAAPAAAAKQPEPASPKKNNAAEPAGSAKKTASPGRAATPKQASRPKAAAKRPAKSAAGRKAAPAAKKPRRRRSPAPQHGARQARRGTRRSRKLAGPPSRRPCSQRNRRDKPTNPNPRTPRRSSP
jgi:hypothetical protein